MIHYLKHSEDTVAPTPKTTRLKEGMSEVHIGPWKCAATTDDQVPNIERFMTDMILKINDWPDSEELKSRLANRRRIIETIREELATIIMKRIVQGSCKYCPL